MKNGVSFKESVIMSSNELANALKKSLSSGRSDARLPDEPTGVIRALSISPFGEKREGRGGRALR